MAMDTAKIAKKLVFVFIKQGWLHLNDLLTLYQSLCINTLSKSCAFISPHEQTRCLNFVSLIFSAVCLIQG